MSQMKEKLRTLMTDLDSRKDEILTILDNERAVEKYCRLQQELRTSDVSGAPGAEFRRRFKGFYRVRRGQMFCDTYFALLEREKRNTALEFSDVLSEVSGDKVEASFASKLVASVRPDLPVWDSKVMNNIGISTTSRPGTRSERMQTTLNRYRELQIRTTTLLQDERFQELRRSFDQKFPNTAITDMKVLDFFLWQYRD